MRTIKNKLNSQRGASLTFALLLFLVCAVVGSAVLVAGTAAAGRMSRIAEMDQRYYSVNSAARLLIELIDNGEEIKITKTVTGTPAAGGSTGSTAVYQDRSGNTLSDDQNFTGNHAIVNEAAYYYVTHDVEGTQPLTRTAPLSLTAGIEALNTSITQELIGTGEDQTFGTMVLTVENGSDDTSGDKYAMELTFNPDVKKTVDKQETKTVTTWKISWHLQNAMIVGGDLRVNP